MMHCASSFFGFRESMAGRLSRYAVILDKGPENPLINQMTCDRFMRNFHSHLLTLSAEMYLPVVLTSIKFVISKFQTSKIPVLPRDNSILSFGFFVTSYLVIFRGN